MAKEVYMPALGMAQESGTLLRWLKAEGDEVTKGEPLMEIATDKTDVEIEAPASGVLRHVTAQEGDEVPVGQVIAWITAPGEAFTPPKSEAAPSSAQPAAPPSASPSAPSPVPSPAQPGSVPPAVSPVAARVAAEHGVDLQQVKPAGARIQKEDVLAHLAAQQVTDQPPAGGRVLASPKARRLAQEAGVDLATISGSGPEGAVLAEDVAAAQARTVEAGPVVQPLPPAAGQEIQVARRWQIMAARLTESWTTVPHFYLTREVDASRLVAWRAGAQVEGQPKVTYSDLIVKAVAMTLRRHPRLNAGWIDGRIMGNDAVHVGLAVAVEDGLLVPVIRHTDRLGVGEIAAARADIVSRAQANKLSVEDLQGGTFTISNLGMFSVDQFNAIVNPPQAAILAVGRIADRVVAVDGQPAVRPMMTLTLSCDHRVVDGARGAQFLDDLAAALEEPLRLLG